MLGVAVGFLFAHWEKLAHIFDPLMVALNAMPRVVLAPLFILWFGLGLESKVALVVVLVFFLTFFNTYQGAREVDEELIAVCRLMRASRWQILLKVIVPSAMVWTAVGLKVSVPYAFVGAVVGEILAGNLGLGALITRAVNQFDANRLMAAVVLTTVLAIILNTVVARATGYFLHWQSAGTTGRWGSSCECAWGSTRASPLRPRSAITV